MEWLVLILVIPLVVVPVVLLAGFAGCGELLTLSPDGATPPSVSNLTVKAQDENKVMLTWLASVAGVERFEIRPFPTRRELPARRPGSRSSTRSGR